MRLLWLDDEFDRIAETMLHFYRNGHKVDQVNNASEAKATLKQNPYDLMLVDYDLGEIKNGIDFIREIERFHPGLATVIVTQFPEQAEATKQRFSLSSQVLCKSDALVAPYDQPSSALLQKLKAILAEKNTIRQRLLHWVGAADRAVLSWANLYNMTHKFGIIALSSLLGLVLAVTFFAGNNPFLDGLIVRFFWGSSFEYLGYALFLSSYIATSLSCPPVLKLHPTFEAFYEHHLNLMQDPTARRRIVDGALNYDGSIMLSDRFLLIDGYYHFLNQRYVVVRTSGFILFAAGFALILVSFLSTASTLLG